MEENPEPLTVSGRFGVGASFICRRCAHFNPPFIFQKMTLNHPKKKKPKNHWIFFHAYSLKNCRSMCFSLETLPWKEVKIIFHHLDCEVELNGTFTYVELFIPWWHLLNEVLQNQAIIYTTFIWKIT